MTRRSLSAIWTTAAFISNLEYLKEYFRFWLAILMGFSTHWFSSELHSLTRYVDHGIEPEIRRAVPWEILAKFAAGTIVLALLLFIKSSLYLQYRRIARLAVVGLIAVQYLGFALLEPPKGWFGLTVSAGMVGALFWLQHRFRNLPTYIADRFTVAFDVKREKDPEPRPGMILFLSFLTGKKPSIGLDFVGKPTRIDPKGLKIYEDSPDWVAYRKHVLELAQGLHKREGGASLKDAEMLGPFGTLNIRMPLEAIRTQLLGGALKHLVLIPSADSKKKGTDRILRELPYTGSGGQVSFFSEVYREVFDPLCAKLPEIEVTDAVDFENEREISHAIDAARRKLADSGASLHYLDVTGGQSICSIVGAVRSLGHSERCQYISTRDYKPIVYDFGDEPAPEIS